jgi:hypothetical protein
MPAASSTGEPGVSVTARGKLLEQFEALLHQRLGTGEVCANAGERSAVTFNKRCQPLAAHHPYLFTFKRPGGLGSLRLISKAPKRGSLGNYPVPIRVRADYVRCGAHGYLILYSDAVSFSLGCDTGI